MSELMKEAIELLNNTNEKFSKIADAMSDNVASEDFQKVNLVYSIAAQLNVNASQLAGEQKVYEGSCIVNNARATVTIGGFTVRGSVRFEIQQDGKWVKGHRCNSQYGQTFVTEDGTTIILTQEHIGRVTLPLVMDNN